MDRVDEYAKLIREILEGHAKIGYSHGDIQSYAIADYHQTHFMLIIVGWDGERRVHGCITHVQIIDGKIWIQRDGIEDGITDELVEAGFLNQISSWGFIRQMSVPIPVTPSPNPDEGAIALNGLIAFSHFTLLLLLFQRRICRLMARLETWFPPGNARGF